METLQKLSRKEKIRKDLPIRKCGLVFYPIQVKHYETFSNCKNALLIRLGTLPVKYIEQDYLSAIFTLEMDVAKTDPNKPLGIFSRILKLLYLSLQVEISDKELAETIFYKEIDGETVLDYITVTQNQKTVKIQPMVFSQIIRPLIAEQNGLKLPDESENVDLVRSYEDKKELESGDYDLDIDSAVLISSVAYKCGCRDKEVDEWTIREFEAKRRAIWRDTNFNMYKQAELSGMVTFKKGNPYKSWEYEIKDDTLGTKDVSETAIGGKMSEIINKGD